MTTLPTPEGMKAQPSAEAVAAEIAKELHNLHYLHYLDNSERNKAAIIQKHLSATLAKVEAERDEYRRDAYDQKRQKDALLAYRDKNFWVWQGDGNDYLESLTCLVMITAADLRAALARGKEDGWQPIETAPANREILLFMPASTGRCPLAAMYVAGQPSNFPFRRPTHWMPLPASPAARTQNLNPQEGM